jgi:dTDP-4-amino-4,6-dideoxygalactose transaminase
MLSVNDSMLAERAEIIWEKGTNRSSFHRREVQKYEWLDTGSSFLMSDISAAFLLSQIEDTETVIRQRKIQWELYYNSLIKISTPEFLRLPEFPVSSEINYSIFYVVLKDKLIAQKLRIYLVFEGIQALTHYLDLARSPYILKTQGEDLHTTNVNSLMYQERLIRLPVYNELSENDIIRITDKIKAFFKNGPDRK